MKVLSSSMPATAGASQVEGPPQSLPPPVGQPVSEITFLDLSDFQNGPSCSSQKFQVQAAAKSLSPVISQVGSSDREIQILLGEISAYVVEELAKSSDGKLLAKEHFVGNNNALKGVIAVLVENVPHLLELASVGRGVIVLPDAQPHFDVVGHFQLGDGVKDHLSLVAISAVETDLVGQLAEHSHITSDVVLRRRVGQTVGILGVKRRVINSGEDLVQVGVVEQVLDLLAVDVKITTVVIRSQQLDKGRKKKEQEPRLMLRNSPLRPKALLMAPAPKIPPAATVATAAPFAARSELEALRMELRALRRE
ncbi:hypothetical protein CFAM422_009717 [Trichoderma lentiforme]|uniref:Uncharacterized protein n=1 Tax=Trichoderma lentiforme TaxID=1567552 RepID=A0A9P4X763_9HYPO|nr:hypothetical protein CFAM422_009717 [Trichoderma lentiforme]